MVIKNQELNDVNSILIRLKGGSSVRIPRKYKYEECTCGKKDIVWGKTLKNKKPIPLRWTHEEGWFTHFSDCPLANSFRKGKSAKKKLER